MRKGLEVRVFVTIKQFDDRGGKEIQPEEYLIINPEERKEE